MYESYKSLSKHIIKIEEFHTSSKIQVTHKIHKIRKIHVIRVIHDIHVIHVIIFDIHLFLRSLRFPLSFIVRVSTASLAILVPKNKM